MIGKGSKMFKNFKKFNYDSSFVRLQERVNNIQLLMHTAITEKKYFDSYSNAIIDSNGRGIEFADGLEAKTSLIRSQKLIYELHEFVKDEFVFYGIDPGLIFPPQNCARPEINLSGRFKQKQQDVCIVPNDIEDNLELIDWGTLKYSGRTSPYGRYKEERILSVNLRSQMSSLAKNSDTLFERMIAEPLNLHIQYPKIVTGELYMIPLYEYNDLTMKSNRVSFKKNITDIEKYISFFTELNGYSSTELSREAFRYNQASLLIVDFNRMIPKIYTTTQELIQDGLVPSNYPLELGEISPVHFVYRLLEEYKDLHDESKIIE